MSSDLAISVKRISKTYRIYDRPQDRLKQSLFQGRRQYYREFRALRDISLEVKKGETVGIIGRNGSGKSTLLQIIAGTLTPSAGEVSVHGRVAALLELGSGFNPEYTGRENVFMYGSILGMSRGEMEALYVDIIEFADIGEYIQQPVKTYSSGMIVRLAFAVQAMIPKDVLIVDEALAVGDELFQRKCFAKIEEFKARGGTILFVSHDGGSIVQLCDRAVLLDAGEALLIGPSKTVVNLYQKYLYAPSQKKEAMRREIREAAFHSTKQSKIVEKNEVEGSKVIEVKSDPENFYGKQQMPMYDPSLVVKNTLQYESRGALIQTPEIVTLGGERANLLIAGKSYVWRYQVKFDMDCENVRFGMLIKTGSGLALGGAASSNAGQGVPFVKAGSVLKVEFTFSPRLLPGTYFMNGGVLGITADGEVYLDRGIDLAVFKILPNENSVGTGFVDFDAIPLISAIDQTMESQKMAEVANV